MIEVPGELVRKFQAMLRRLVLVARERISVPVRIESCKTGLTLTCRHGGVGLRHHLPGARAAAVLALTAETLEAIAVGETVLLEPVPAQGVRASWKVRGETQTRELAGIDPSSLPPWPVARSRRLSAGQGFLQALDEAARTAARTPDRASLSRVLLRGPDGAVAGTDGRQLYVETRHALPWKETLLVPALPVFGCRELGTTRKITLARVEENLRIEADSWTIDLASESGKTFPDIDRVVRRAEQGETRLEVHEADATEVQRRLVGVSWNKTLAAITLDVTQSPAVVRVPGECGSDEFRLARSQVVGRGVVLTMAREYLMRALTRGFRAITLAQDGVLLCKEGRRAYLWMAHAAEADVAHGSKCVAAEPGSPLQEFSDVAGLLEDALERTRRVLARLEQEKGKSRSSTRSRRGR